MVILVEFRPFWRIYTPLKHPFLLKSTAVLKTRLYYCRACSTSMIALMISFSGDLPAKPSGRIARNSPPSSRSRVTSTPSTSTRNRLPYRQACTRAAKTRPCPRISTGISTVCYILFNKIVGKFGSAGPLFFVKKAADGGPDALVFGCRLGLGFKGALSKGVSRRFKGYGKNGSDRVC